MKIINNLFFVLFLSIMISVNTADGYFYAQAKVTIRVSDEAGNPFEGAETYISFLAYDKNDNPAYATTKKGLTDPKGQFSASDISHGDIKYSVHKEGYYRTMGEYGWDRKNREDGKWIPWNPTIDVILKKIENPVPMYAKRVQSMVIHDVGTPFGFDLEKGDWVEPHGKGKISDLIFRGVRQCVNLDNFEIRVEMTFPNKGDGIQTITAPMYYGSSADELRLPKTAPEGNYQEKWSKTLGSRPQTGRYDWEEKKNLNFISLS